MTRTVLIGPTGPGIRTVNLATGPSGATGLWEQCGYTGHGPTGKYETVQIAATRDNTFKSLAVAGYTGTVTADSGGGGGDNTELREDGGFELREDGGLELRE